MFVCLLLLHNDLELLENEISLSLEVTIIVFQSPQLHGLSSIFMSPFLNKCLEYLLKQPEKQPNEKKLCMILMKFKNVGLDDIEIIDCNIS